MSNISIYHSATDRTPYTYLIGWKYLDTWYYGRRTAKNCHPSDLFVKYFTSSVYVKDFIIKNGKPDIVRVHKTFDSITACNEYEVRFLKKVNATLSSRWLNESYGDGKFDCTGKVVVTDGHRTFQVRVDDEKYLTGEYISIFTGKVTVKDENGNSMQVSTSDPRYISGELKSITHGKTIAVDSSGNNILVSLDDPKYVSGEYKNYLTGKVTVKDSLGNTMVIDKNDSRYITGELVPLRTGMVSVVDIFGNNMYVSVTDKNYINGNLKSIHKDKILVKDNNGEYFKVHANDSRLATGELTVASRGMVSVVDKDGNTKRITISELYENDNYIGVNYNKVVVVDKDGNKFSVNKNDKRLCSGELITLSKWTSLNNKNTKRYLKFIVKDIITNEIISLSWNEYSDYFKCMTLPLSRFIKYKKYKNLILLEYEINPDYRK